MGAEPKSVGFKAFETLSFSSMRELLGCIASMFRETVSIYENQTGLLGSLRSSEVFGYSVSTS